MIIYCVTVYVKEGYIKDFITATVDNHNRTRQESGNIRFDVLQNKDDPTRFFLYEVYDSEEAAQAHKKTKHYLHWRETVAKWMAKSREGILHTAIVPLDRGQW